MARAITPRRPSCTAPLQKGGVDAGEVNTRLGIALAAQGDKAGATAAFDAVKGAPRADLAGFLEGLALDPGIRSSSAPIRRSCPAERPRRSRGLFRFGGRGETPSHPPFGLSEVEGHGNTLAWREAAGRVFDFAQRERLSGQ
jgi:hypothetical protein